MSLLPFWLYTPDLKGVSRGCQGQEEEVGVGLLGVLTPHRRILGEPSRAMALSLPAS